MAAPTGTSFPTSLDVTATAPFATAAVSGDQVTAALYNTILSAINALEAKLGISASTPTNGKLLIGDTVAGTAIWSNTIPTGGLTITAGGLTVSASGVTVTGNSTITGTLGGLTGLTVASGVSAYPAGTVGAPSIHLGSATTGLYASAANEIAVAVSGAQIAKFAGTTTTLAGALVVSGTVTGVTTLTATTLAGTLSTAAQPNITSTGVLASPHFTTATVDSGGLAITAGLFNPSAASVPQCDLYMTGNQSYAGSWAPFDLLFTAEHIDTDTMHSTVANQARITFTTAGTYLISGQIQVSPNSAQTFIVKVKDSGASIVRTFENVVSGGVETISFSFPWKSADSTYLDFTAEASVAGVVLGTINRSRVTAVRISAS